MNPSFPKIYGQVKLHKENHPIRPVVACYTDPTYKLAKYLVSWFRSCSSFEAKFTIKNSFELTSMLQPMNFPVGSILTSFDVSNMFTKIPVARAVPLMIQHLERKKIHPLIIKEFHHLISLCLKQNVCVFRGKT